MMQIFIDAIEKSRTDDTQYVLFKSLDMEHVSDKRVLLELLQDGWQIMGEFHNGIGYEKYYIESAEIIKSFISYLSNEIFKRSINNDVVQNANTIYMCFQFYYESITCKPDGANVGITFFQHKGNQCIPEHFRIENSEDVESVKRFLNIFGVKQDNDALIDLLEKELEVKSQC